MKSRPLLLAIGISACFWASLIGYVTASHADAIEDINARVNASIRVAPTKPFDWTIRAEGDCKTFAATKRRDLIAAGYHPAVWLVTTPAGEPHAVVTVGDRVLDNRSRWTQSMAEFLAAGNRLVALYPEETFH